MAPVGSKDVRRTKTPHGRKVVFLPQAHHTPNMSDRERKATAKSQCMIAKRLYDDSLSIPRREGDLGLFMRRNAGKILYVFAEGEAGDSSPRHYHHFKKTSPNEFKEIQKTFPGRKLPPCNKVSPVQGDFLIAYGGATITQLLGRAVYTKGAVSYKNEEKASKVSRRYIAKYGWPSRFGKAPALTCLRFGNNEFRRTMYNSREENIVRKVGTHKGPGLLYMIIGALHVMDKYDGKYGLKIIVPKMFARFRDALFGVKGVWPSIKDRGTCAEAAYKLNATLLTLKREAIANPDDRADYIEKQQAILDYLAEGEFPVLEVKTLNSLLNQSLKQRALKHTALVRATLTALKFTTRLVEAAFTLGASGLFNDK